mmetsp:Transcript_31947/g.50953  ORF Transcript_31947/g.50953 Transcript_31947/m.50953 type:complete len:237 (+) Transcript_31947:3224-3934(+)
MSFRRTRHILRIFLPTIQNSLIDFARNLSFMWRSSPGAFGTLESDSAYICIRRTLARRNIYPRLPRWISQPVIISGSCSATNSANSSKIQRSSQSRFLLSMRKSRSPNSVSPSNVIADMQNIRSFTGFDVCVLVLLQIKSTTIVRTTTTLLTRSTFRVPVSTCSIASTVAQSSRCEFRTDCKTIPGAGGLCLGLISTLPVLPPVCFVETHALGRFEYFFLAFRSSSASFWFEKYGG